MRKDFGFYLYCLLLFMLVIFFQKNHKGFAEIVSDWRGVRVDYSTNAVVCNYYGGQSKWLRQRSWDEIMSRLKAGEALTFGIDYYALYPISRPLIPVEILKRADTVIRKGGVFVYKLEWKK